SAGRLPCHGELKVATAPGTDRAPHRTWQLAAVTRHRTRWLPGRERVDDHQSLVRAVPGGVEIEHTPGQPSSGVQGPTTSLSGRRRHEQGVEKLEACEVLERIDV